MILIIPLTFLRTSFSVKSMYLDPDLSFWGKGGLVFADFKISIISFVCFVCCDVGRGLRDGSDEGEGVERQRFMF